MVSEWRKAAAELVEQLETASPDILLDAGREEPEPVGRLRVLAGLAAACIRDALERGGPFLKLRALELLDGSPGTDARDAEIDALRGIGYATLAQLEHAQGVSSERTDGLAEMRGLIVQAIEKASSPVSLPPDLFGGTLTSAQYAALRTVRDWKPTHRALEEGAIPWRWPEWQEVTLDLLAAGLMRYVERGPGAPGMSGRLALTPTGWGVLEMAERGVWWKVVK